MSVYFVYRSHYDNPGCKHVRKFDADSVLKWFRQIWKPVADGASEHSVKLLGRRVYSFPRLFEAIAEQELDPPGSMEELASILESTLYIGEMHHGPHHLEILTDDDELEMAVYIFDDKYAAKRPDRVAFLMREEWQLPGGAVEGEFKAKAKVQDFDTAGGDGAVYFISLMYEDSGNLSDLDSWGGPVRIAGVRYREFARYLLTAEVGEHRELASLTAGVRAAIAAATGDEAALLAGVAANPADDAAWSAYSDWLEEHDCRPAGEHLLGQALRRAAPRLSTDTRDPGKDLFLVQPHVAQACLHSDKWGETDLFHHWILFDDLWAAANPDLANSVLRFASRWDVLGQSGGG